MSRTPDDEVHAITRDTSNCFPIDTKPATFRCWNFSFVPVPETLEQRSNSLRPVNTKAHLVQMDNRHNRRTASTQMARDGIHPSNLTATNPPAAGNPFNSVSSAPLLNHQPSAINPFYNP